MGIAIVKSANKNAGNKNFISGYTDLLKTTTDSQIIRNLKFNNL